MTKNARQEPSLEKNHRKSDIVPFNSLNQEVLATESKRKHLHPAVTTGLVGIFIAHAAILLSLPPVIRGKGAPFLPTAARGLETMFEQIRQQPRIMQKLRRQENIRFVDLGSGDGRVVFRAARESIFSKCIGVEINPLLHVWSSIRRIVQAHRYWTITNFILQDLWSVDLRNADVVAVYGLHPIMDNLGKKMRNEMKNGSFVVSNVFTIPRWKPIGTSSKNGVYLYSIPESFEKKVIIPQTRR